MSSFHNEASVLNADVKVAALPELDLSIRMISETIASAPWSAGCVDMKATRTILAAD